MKKKYTKEEKKTIAKEAMESKNKSDIALKHDIHVSTLYSWIDKYYSKEGRTVYITVRVNEKEKEELQKNCNELGYGNDVSTYLRRLIFGNTIASGNPKEIINELYSNRAELNKIGSNFNQIANYTNFLHSKQYVEDGYEKDFRKYSEEMNDQLFQMRAILDKTIRKIHK